MRRRPSRWHGVLPVHKLAGPTSHDVVDMARRALGERRIGHTGTLDPMAEGLLLLCVGQATRLQRYLMRWDKVYQGEIRLGFATTTYDAEGEPTEPQGEPPVLDREALAALEERFSGVIDQVPPPYSAKKVAGKKLYELARSGQQLEVDAKRVEVHDLHLEQPAPDRLRAELRTSTGFYVRSLAHDLGVAIGCGGHLHHLCRPAMGPFHIDAALPQAVLLEARDSAEVTGHAAWMPIDRVVLPFPSVDLNPTASDRFMHGQEVIIFRSGGEALATDARVVVRGPAGELLGVGVVAAVLARGRTIGVRPESVLAPPPENQSTVARGETS